MLDTVIRKIRVHLASRSRGQSLVEFALTLPVILLLTLIALDFGRVYLGYINLQNMARIAANYAANNPSAWEGAGDATKQAEYKNQVVQDALMSNCQLPVVAGKTVVPAPQFTDANGDGDAYSLGDTVAVHLACRFTVITPLIANILGGTVGVGASSEFPVKAGMATIAPIGTSQPGGGSPPVAAFIANGTILSPNPIKVVGPTVDVEFRDTSGGAPIAWAWDFGDGTTSGLQDPLNHTFTCAFASCDFVVKLKATNLAGSSTTTMTVTVLGASNVNFSSDKQTGTVPLTVNFTDASSPGGTAWAWTFGDGQTGTGVTVAHTYTKVGTYDVKLTVTYPSPIGDVSVTKSAYITVSVATCTVPKLVGNKYNNTAAIWSGAGFTGTVSRGPGAPNGNFTVTAQSQVYTAQIDCSSSVQLTAP